MRPNQLVETFLLKKDFAGPLRGVSGSGNCIQELSKEICNGNSTSTSNILLTTGVGLDPAGRIPVRLPVLLVPALRVMEGFVRIGLPPPQYLVYQATGFIASTNGFDAHLATQTSNKILQYLTAYVAKFHPILKDHVVFRFENAAQYDISRQQVVEKVANILRRQEYHRDMEVLRQYRIHNKRPEGSEFPYGAANVLYNGGHESSYPFSDIIHKSDIKAVLPIGGGKEQPFFELTKVMKEREACTSEKGKFSIIPLLQRAGDMPTYYPCAQGDILSGDELMQNFSHLHGAVRHDLDVLKNDVLDLQSLANIYTGLTMN